MHPSVHVYSNVMVYYGLQYCSYSLGLFLLITENVLYLYFVLFEKTFVFQRNAIIVFIYLITELLRVQCVS